MKSLIVMISLIAISITKLSAQWVTSVNNIINTNTGNVGIGTATPSGKLEVSGGLVVNSALSASGQIGLLGKIAGTNTFLVGGDNLINAGTDQGLSLYAYGSNLIRSYTNGIERSRLTVAGNLLLGTTTDNAIDKLQVNGSVLGTSFKKLGGTSSQFLKADGTVDNLANAMMYRGELLQTDVDLAIQNGYYTITKPGLYNSSLLTFNSYGSVGPLQMNFDYWGEFKFRNQTNSNPMSWTSWKYVCTGRGTPNQLTKFTGYSEIGNSIIYDNGNNVGIGIADPLAKMDVNGNIYCRNTMYIGIPDGNTVSQLAGYSLAVNGTAIFNRAKVKLYGNWPDYVFDDTYNLLALPELEKFIVKNKHLPDMPSAAEITNDGIDLGHNQAILLEKIEELTLHLIEQNKKLESQIVEISKLKIEINALQRK